MADAHSRDIFFVSMARSMAIPARINGVTGKVQLIGDDGAMDVDLNHHPEEPVFMAEGIASKGKLVASYKPIRSLDNPKYYSHFTLSKQTRRAVCNCFPMTKAMQIWAAVLHGAIF